jgi:hypothetical protein
MPRRFGERARRRADRHGRIPEPIERDTPAVFGSLFIAIERC